MKLKDRLRALQLLWEINDTVLGQMPYADAGLIKIQDAIIELRRIVERQTRQGTPR